MKRLKKFARYASILVVSLLLSEAYLRVFNPIPLVPRNVISSSFGIRVNKPDHTYWQVTPDYRIKVHTNSKGVRSDVDFSYEKPAGVRRIVVLGDSFGMGFEVDLQDTFLALMERVLKERFPCEVINLSVSGLGTAEELVMLRNEGIKYHPDLVLLVWHATDLADNVRSALYRVEDDKLVRFHETYLPGTRINEMLSAIPGYTFIAENSQLYFLIRETVAVETKDLLLRSMRFFTRTRRDDHATTAAVDDRAEKKLAYLLLKEIQSTCQAVGAKFAVLDIPLPVDGKFISLFLKEEDGFPYGFDVISPIPELEKHRGAPLYWLKYHRHFTPAGCEVVGKFLAETVLDRGLLR